VLGPLRGGASPFQALPEPLGVGHRFRDEGQQQADGREGRQGVSPEEPGQVPLEEEPRHHGSDGGADVDAQVIEGPRLPPLLRGRQIRQHGRHRGAHRPLKETCEHKDERRGQTRLEEAAGAVEDADEEQGGAEDALPAEVVAELARRQIADHPGQGGSGNQGAYADSGRPIFW
jgi:hypothetical protein